MFKKKKYFNAPYETLSDLAIGSLGVFIILVIVLVVILSFSKGKNNPSEQVIEKNQQLQAKIESVEDEYENRKSQDLASK